MSEISASDPLCGPYEDDLERVRRRLAEDAEKPAGHPVPSSAEALLTLAEERRDAIVESLRRGQQGVSVRDNKTFARFFRGEIPGCFPLPNLERLWNAAYALGLPDVPPWAGEPDDSPSALERLGVLIGWLRSKQQPSPAVVSPAVLEGQLPANEAGADLAVFLKANPSASEDEAAAAMEWSLDRLRKSDVWQEHRNDCLRGFYRDNPGAKHEDAAAFLEIGRSTLSGMSAYKEEVARRDQSKPPSPAMKRGNISERQLARLEAGKPRVNDPKRDALHAAHYTEDGGAASDPDAFRSLLLNVFDGVNETAGEYRRILNRLNTERLEQLKTFLKGKADPNSLDSVRMFAENFLDLMKQAERGDPRSVRAFAEYVS